MLTARYHDRRAELAVDGEEIGARVSPHSATEPFDGGDRGGDDFGVSCAKRAVDLDVAVVARRREPDQSIGSDEAPEAPGIGAARGHVLRLVDDEAREMAVALEQVLETVEHLLVGEPPIAFADHPLRCEERLRLDDPFEGFVGAHPLLGRVDLALLLQLERAAVVDVVTDVLFVRQHLMDGAAGPGPAEVGRDATFVEKGRDLALDLALVDELPIHPTHRLELVGGSGDQDHPVCLQALVFPLGEDPLGCAALVDAHAAQSEACHAALAVSVLDEPALAGEHLGRQLAAVLGGHCALYTLHDGRYGRPVVDELLGAVVHLDVGAAAGELVGRALVGVLKPSPPAHVINKDGSEISLAPPDVVQQLPEPVPVVQMQAALGVIGIGAHNLQIVLGGVAADDRDLVLGRVLLVFRRHADIGSSRANPRWEGRVPYRLRRRLTRH